MLILFLHFDLVLLKYLDLVFQLFNLALLLLIGYTYCFQPLFLPFDFFLSTSSDLFDVLLSSIKIRSQLRFFSTSDLQLIFVHSLHGLHHCHKFSDLSVLRLSKVMVFSFLLLILGFRFFFMFCLSNQSLTGELNFASQVRNLLFMLKCYRGHFDLQILNSGSLF